MKYEMKKSIAISLVILVAIVAMSGCTGQQPVADNESKTTASVSVLPSLGSWAMEKADINSPEDVAVNRGIYKNGDKLVILDVVTGKSENIVKNALFAKAHDAIEEPVTTEGLVGKSSATYMTDSEGAIHVLYFIDENKIGYFAVADDKAYLEEFFSSLFGTVMIG